MNLFINYLVQNENFKASEILVNFLSCEDRKKFKSKFNEYQTEKLNDNVEEYKTLDGKITIINNEDIGNYFDNIPVFFGAQKTLTDRLDNY